MSVVFSISPAIHWMCLKHGANGFHRGVTAQITDLQRISSLGMVRVKQFQFSPFLTQKEIFLVAIFFFFLKTEPAFLILYSL